MILPEQIRGWFHPLNGNRVDASGGSHQKGTKPIFAGIDSITITKFKYLMKKRWYVFILLAILLACKGKEKGNIIQESPVATLNINCTIDIKIDGMKCTGCENAVKGGLSSLPGIAEVSASYETGIAKVRFDSTQTNIEAMKSVIEKKGYKVIYFKRN
jgi:copper chaperone